MGGLGIGLFLVIAVIIIVIYAVRRSMEGAAFRKAEQLAAQGDHAGALRAIMSAEGSWGFNAAHDVRSTRVAALDRLDQMMRLAYAQSCALGRPVDLNEVGTLIQQLRHLLGTKEHYSWGSDASLKGEYKQYMQPMIGQLHAARARFRAACTGILG